MHAGVVLGLQLLVWTGTGASYAEAHKMTIEKGCPLVVMVSATWCPACQQMKQQVIPQVAELGILRKVAFAEVDLEQERQLGTELTDGGPIPQIVVYRKTPLGWRQRRLVGGHDVRTVERFLRESIQADPGESAK